MILPVLSSVSWAGDHVDDTPTVAWLGDEAEGKLGGAAATGDVNGDGLEDIVVSAPGAIPGRIDWYLGAAGGFGAAADGSVDGSDTDYFGLEIAAGDLNGDGFTDVVATTWWADLSVFRGAASGLDTTPLRLPTPLNVSFQPTQLAANGDINGDGYADLLVGRIETAGQGLFVYLGTPTGPADTQDLTEEYCLPGATDFEWIAESCALAYAGDVNGDGFDDVLVGITDGRDEPRALLFASSATELDAPTRFLGDTDGLGDTYGASVAALGDVNGDGYADFAVADPQFYEAGDGSRASGRVYTYYGSATDPGGDPTILAAPDGALAFGDNIAGTHDFDADGFDDVIVSAPNTADFEGAVYVYAGDSSGITTTDPTLLTGASPGDFFGGAIAGVKDTNADGADELLVTAPTYGEADFGAAWIFMGIPDSDADADTDSDDDSDVDTDDSGKSRCGCHDADAGLKGLWLSAIALAFSRRRRSPWKADSSTSGTPRSPPPTASARSMASASSSYGTGKS